MSASETKKSRLDTRPRSSGGTRRCSRVPQITVAEENPKPVMKTTTAMTHNWSVKPINSSGMQPAPHSRFITVR